MKSLVFAIDFDGTCTTHEFPHVGVDIGAAPVLKKLVDKGHKIILYTMRCNHTKPPISNDPDITPLGGNYLEAAENWFRENGIPLYGVQKNPGQDNWTSSPKCYANFYIDDAAIGCPLIYNSDISERPFVDWSKMEQLLIDGGIL